MKKYEAIQKKFFTKAKNFPLKDEKINSKKKSSNINPQHPLTFFFYIYQFFSSCFHTFILSVCTNIFSISCCVFSLTFILIFLRCQNIWCPLAIYTEPKKKERGKLVLDDTFYGVIFTIFSICMYSNKKIDNIPFNIPHYF